MIFVVLLICIISFGLSLYIYKRAINPFSIFITVHLIALLVSLGLNVNNNKFSSKTLVIILLTFSAYIIGLIISKRYRFTIKGVKCNVTDITKLKMSIKCFSILFDTAVFLYILDIEGRYGIKKVINELNVFNKVVQDGFFDGRIYFLLLPVGITLSMMIMYYICNSPEKSKTLFKIQYCICFIPFISVRRGLLFTMIFMNIIVFYFINKPLTELNTEKNIKKKKRVYLKLILIVLASLFFMSITQSMMKKGNEVNLTFLGVEVPDVFEDPLIYVGCNYSYFNEQINNNEANFISPGISTFRLPIRYISDFLSVDMDTTTSFALDFKGMNVNSQIILFNTTPIIYYILIESGIMFIVIFIFIGYIAGRGYAKLLNKNNMGELIIGSFIFTCLFWSFRGYDLIYLSSITIFLSMLLVAKITNVSKGK